MKLSTHIRVTREKLGVEAEDIHKWIDGCFDHKRFEEFKRTGFFGNFNPYSHRIHRHCQEAVEECVAEFKDRYSEELIRRVFELHVRTDYSGEFPERKEFHDPGFHEKHHTK